MRSHTLIKLLFVLAIVCLVTAKQSRTCKRTGRFPTKPINPVTTGKATGSSSLKIVTGPIIGRVNTTTARLVIEFDAEAPITVILTDADGNKFNSSKTTKKSIPVPFAFEGLKPNTKYTVSLNDSRIEMVESYFTTLSGEPGKLNFAVLSCNDQGIQAGKTAEGDLWADLLRRIKNNEVQYLLQTGDQVYMDDPSGGDNATKPYFASIKILNETPRDQWNTKRDQLLELLRNEYRQTWGITSIKESLAKIPSLTIADDHQFRDDWGYRPEDSDPNSIDYYYGQLARQVSYEYERQLREDVDFDNLSNITQDYYYEILNDIGFFFIDYRGIRTWNRNFSQMGDTQLGLNQTQLIGQVLDPANGAFSKLNNFFLVSPLTMVFLVESLVKIGYYNNDDAQESWSYGYSDEQTQLLDTLRNWKLAQDGREVTILDGDIHIGGYTDIYYGSDDSDNLAFVQFTTSSMASSAPDDATFAAFDLIKEAQNLQDPWTYEHHDWTNKFNYGIVFSRFANNQATNQCYLVEADGDEAPTIVNADGSDVDDNEWNEILAN